MSRDNKLLSAKELADCLGISRRYVYYMAKQNRIPSIRIGRLRRFSYPETIAILKKENGHG